eukprot:SAG11_NODE_32335_length_284_cov_1.108108_1_plen_33_part_01
MEAEIDISGQQNANGHLLLGFNLLLGFDLCIRC